MRRAAFLAALLGLLALPAHAPSALAADDKPDGDKKQKAPEHKVTQSPSFVEIQDLYTTIVGDNRAVGMLMVRVGLDVPDAAMRADINHSMPVLQDAYLRNMMAFTTTSVHLDAQPDVAVIAGRLQAVTDRALKKKGARVLLREVALRAK